MRLLRAVIRIRGEIMGTRGKHIIKVFGEFIGDGEAI